MTLQPIRPTDEPALTTLHIRRWHDPLIDQLGHDARSRYVERFWLGILGPSTTLLLRALTDELDAGRGEAEVNLDDVAAQLGIGHKGGRNSALSRSLQRGADSAQLAPPVDASLIFGIVFLLSTARRSNAYQPNWRPSISASSRPARPATNIAPVLDDLP